MSDQLTFPKNGVNPEEVLKLMQEYKTEDVDWKHGRSFSLTYPVSDDHHEFLKKAHNMFFSENALNPMAFKSLRRFEHETIRMCADIFHGGEEMVGLVTSGGTESLLMAIKSYRERARKLKPWILKPEMIVPETIHSAVDKGGYYFDVKVRHAPIGPDYRVDLKALRKMINRNTILIMGSAPQYPHGVVDPIIQLGEIAEEYNLPLHVDACIGGFVLPFIEKLGHPVPVFDFRVPGVTSISADIHKYGYAAKGASALMYRNMNYMKYQFFVYTKWKGGGIYASPSFPGTRPGGPIAAAWATLMKLGEDGYLDLTKKVLETRDYFIKELSKISELKLLAYPDSTLVSFCSQNPKVGIYAVADQLQAKGWNVTRQQDPESIHLTISPVHHEHMSEFVSDLKEAVEVVKSQPELNTQGQAAMYGMMAKIPFKGMIKGSVMGIMEKMYGANNKSIDDKKEEVETWGDFAEKLGTNAFELWSKIKKSK
jgi:glutamate/tyrosine decarboxylase-like PLP-dependent enzyme